MHDDKPIFNELCQGCQRREAIINAYAEQVVAQDMCMEDLTSTVASYRELLSVALEKLSAFTVSQQHQRNRIADLLAQLRQRSDWTEGRRAA